MSTSGIYNFHPKVANPGKVFYQMESDTFQPPFYFGGSQVPVNLGLLDHEPRFRTPHISHLDHMQHLSTQGRGIQTTIRKYHKIYLPKHLSTIKKVI